MILQIWSLFSGPGVVVSSTDVDGMRAQQLPDCHIEATLVTSLRLTFLLCKAESTTFISQGCEMFYKISRSSWWWDANRWQADSWWKAELQLLTTPQESTGLFPQEGQGKEQLLYGKTGGIGFTGCLWTNLNNFSWASGHRACLLLCDIWCGGDGDGCIVTWSMGCGLSQLHGTDRSFSPGAHNWTLTALVTY